MELALLLDIGSTYTKATVVDIEKAKLVANAKAFTTVAEDINIGIKNAFASLEKKGIDLDKVKYRLACSSAAGGLKMVALGLVPELTTEAAKRAALGAGAKLEKVYSFELSLIEIREITKMAPDIILLAGGTDGGNKDVILKNAKILAKSEVSSPIVIAGNKVVAEEAFKILKRHNKEAYLTENVMPKLEHLNVEPARKTIRDVFLKKIIYAKGLAKAQNLIDRLIMPTPSAVMAAAQLLAEGTTEESGYGELLVVDIGGATTDIHSVATGAPTKTGIILKGLEEPYVKRTVEGDLGMRYSASALLKAFEEKEIKGYLPEQVKIEDLYKYIEKVEGETSYLPTEEFEKDLEEAIAKAATKLAVKRHVGHIEVVYTPFGTSYVQYGKDMTQSNLVIGTGGALINSTKPFEILKYILFTENEPTVLAPINPKLMLDQEYILSAVGLVREMTPTGALRLIKNYLRSINYGEGS